MRPSSTLTRAAEASGVYKVPSPTSEDELSSDMVLSPAEVTPALLDLEMHGKITRLAGGLLSKT
mgnify:CR=1 FL=1